MATNYILYFEPYSYINYDKNIILIVNTITNKKKILKSNKIVCSFIEKIKKNYNKRTILYKEDINEHNVKKFIKALREIFCGDVLTIEPGIKPPYFPNNELIIEEDRHIFLEQDYKGDFRIESLTEYLHEITIYINDECSTNCSYCFLTHKQIDCCFNSNKKISSLTITCDILTEQLKYYSVKRINIVAGSLPNFIKEYENIKKLLNYTISMKIILHYKRIDYKDFLNILRMNNRLNFELIVDDLITSKEIEQLKSILICDIYNINLIYIIYSKRSYNYYNKFIELFPKIKINPMPIFTGRNKTFILNLLTIRYKELLKKNITIEELEINKIINKNNFGKIFIYSDGHIKSSRNLNISFNLRKTSIKKVLLDELKNNLSWKRTRKDVPICMECVFNQLCPPIHSISEVLNKNNLCNYSPINLEVL